MTNYNDGKWHGWNGGECPVHPKTEIEVRWRSEFASLVGTAEKFSGGAQWTWHDNISNRIVAFRVVKEHKEPREFWIAPSSYHSEGHLVVRSDHPDAIHVREVME